MRYAQIDDNGICIGVSDLSGEVDAPHMIPIGPEDNPIGFTWDGNGWIAPPPLPVPPPPYNTLTKAAFTALVSIGLSSSQKLALRKDEAMELAWMEIGDLGDAIPRDHEYTTSFLDAARGAGLLSQSQVDAVLSNWPW